MKVKTTIVFDELLNSDESDKRIVVAQGGSRSGKTYNILIYWIYRLLQENNKTLSIVRKTLPALKNSVLKDLKEVLELFGVYKDSDWHKMEGFFQLGTNTINWFSVDEPQKLRGSKRDYLYCNEANELNIEDWNQLIFRTTDKVILDLNPSEITCWVYDLEKREDCYYFKTTWKDNPFVDKNIVKELENLKFKDENLYRIYTLGEKGVPTTLIFNTYNTIQEIPEYAKLLGYGVDFGYNDPSTLIAVYQNGEDLYFDEKLYVKNLTIQDFIFKMKQENLNSTDYIWADSAAPQAIEEIRRERFNIRGVNKKSILHGLDLMKRHKIYITEKSDNILKEFKSYKWKTDKDGNLLDAPEDKDNHTIDSIRYVLESTIGNKQKKFNFV
jgi:phage terminase large subunit